MGTGQAPEGEERYPGYDVLGQAPTWDDVTKGVVLGSFAVPNLYVCDGSVLPTQGSANPALTIMALAARCADHLAARRARR
jgi:choline dehydrogenase-like flavoprotein